MTTGDIEYLQCFNIEFKNKELKTIGNLLKKMFEADYFTEKEYTYEDVLEQI